MAKRETSDAVIFADICMLYWTFYVMQQEIEILYTTEIFCVQEEEL